jgi:hypothetical protein
MATPSPAIAALFWDVRLVTLGSLTLSIARLRTTLFFPRTANAGGHLGTELCWVDTGAPLSVVPLRVHQRLMWQALGVQATWLGQPCDLGRIEVWFPGAPGSPARGPFPMIAKFARTDPPGDPVPVLLGLEFILTHQANLQLPPPPQQGQIQVP